ncbi:calcium/sodium antiporter [Candidatus Peregrinibacteria bacterium]|jgi:cation:H+ antiporter|nr:calcium/sodium antiporter [Candidatus Peregrinibacteria bacterium]
MLESLMPYALFLVGFVILLKGADLMINGASSIAKRLKISPLVIGLTIVAFGTSAPELLVNIVAAVGGSPDLAIGNAIGSNISNILLILGVAGLIYPLTIGHGTVWKEIPFALLGILVVFTMANDVFLDGAASSALSRIDGIILLGFFVIFIYYTYGISRVQGSDDHNGIKLHATSTSILFLILGFAGLGFGSKWVVDGATTIAQNFGLSESMIGLTIVALGTSLPELAATGMAAYRKHSDMAIGNIVGSNIFNTLFVLGTTSVIAPLHFSPSINTDIYINIAATVLLFLAIFITKKNKLERWESAIFLSFYVGYIVYLVMRG